MEKENIREVDFTLDEDGITFSAEGLKFKMAREKILDLLDRPWIQEEFQKIKNMEVFTGSDETVMKKFIRIERSLLKGFIFPQIAAMFKEDETQLRRFYGKALERNFDWNRLNQLKKEQRKRKIFVSGKQNTIESRACLCQKHFCSSTRGM